MLPMPRSILISLEGNIGAGKSTLLRELAALGEPDVVVVQEPVGLWCEPALPDGRSMLDAYYGDRKGNALAFQMYAMLTRVQQLAEVSRLAETTPGLVIVTERSSWSDYELFGRPMRDSGLLGDAEWHAYTAWFEAVTRGRTDAGGEAQKGLRGGLPGVGVLMRPSGTAYLRCSPSKCLERVNRRARSAEDGTVDVGYLEMLHDAHERYVRGASPPGPLGPPGPPGPPPSSGSSDAPPDAPQDAPPTVLYIDGSGEGPDHIRQCALSLLAWARDLRTGGESPRTPLPGVPYTGCTTENGAE